MGFLDNFISVKKDENETQAPATSAKTVIPAETSPSPVINQPTILLNGGVVDQKFVEHFTKVLEDANLPGPDYYEFRKAFDDTVEFQSSMTEATRMKMVFKTMSSSGLSKDILISSATSYKKVLETDKDKFLKTVESTKQTEIVNREKQVEQLINDNQAKNEQIVKLQQDIQDNLAKVAEIKTEITSVTNKIETNQTNFTVTYNAFVNQIDADVEKINTNL